MTDKELHKLKKSKLFKQEDIADFYFNNKIILKIVIGTAGSEGNKVDDMIYSLEL